jgi:hypothetical protein
LFPSNLRHNQSSGELTVSLVAAIGYEPPYIGRA